MKRWIVVAMVACLCLAGLSLVGCKKKEIPEGPNVRVLDEEGSAKEKVPAWLTSKTEAGPPKPEPAEKKK